jgi:hypothetical protein
MWHSVDLDVVALGGEHGLSPFLHISDRLLDHVIGNAQGDPAEASFESCHCLLHLGLVKGHAALDLRPQEEIQGIQVWRIPWKSDRLDVDLLLGVLILAALVGGTKAPSNLPSCVSGTKIEAV